MAVEVLIDKLRLKKNPLQAIANTALVAVNRANVEAYAKNWETWLPK
jgi:ribose transport system substrate-binding protein